MARNWARRSLILAILLAMAIWLARAPWREVIEALRPLSMRWVALGILIGVGSIALRAARLAWALDGKAPFPRVWRSVGAGYLASIVLPLGAGELVKVGMLRSHARIQGAQALTAITLDRSLDALSLILLLVWATSHRLFQFAPGRLAQLLGGGLVLAVAAIALLPLWAPKVRERLARARDTVWLARWDQAVSQAIRLRQPHYWALVAPLQILIFGMDLLGTQCLLMAHPMTHPLPFAAAVQTTALVMLSFAIPVLPGSLGSYQAAWTLSMAGFGLPESLGLALGLVGQAAHTAIIGLIGGLAVSGSGGVQAVLAIWRGRASDKMNLAPPHKEAP